MSALLGLEASVNGSDRLEERSRSEWMLSSQRIMEAFEVARAFSYQAQWAEWQSGSFLLGDGSSER